ncbi:hypothetical protein WH52_07465, partial [Tenacibaculum holothuriorum]
MENYYPQSRKKTIVFNKTLIVFFILSFLSIVSFYGQTTYIDNFNSISYSNNNGNQNFASDWIEDNDDDDPANGRIQVRSNGRLRFQNIDDRSIFRYLDLSGVTPGSTVTLTLDYYATNRGGEGLYILLYNNDTSNYDIVGTINTNTNSSINHPLTSGQISANSEIWIVGTDNSWGGSDRIFIDNVTFTVVPPVIVYDETNSVLANNTGAISGNVLTDGTPDAGTGLFVSEVDVYPAMVGNTYTTLYGSVTIQSNGSYTYNVDENNPAVYGLKAGASLDDVISYTVEDVDGYTDYGILTITINGVNDLPDAVNNTDSITAFTEVDTTGNLITDDTGDGQDIIDRGVSELVWESQYADNSNVNGTSLTIDGVGITLSSNDPDGLGSSSNHQVSYLANGGHTGYLRLTADGTTTSSQDHTITIDFDQAVYNLGFLITDLDYSQGNTWQDQVTVEGSLNGTPVSFNFTTTGGVTQVGANTFYGTGVAIPEDATGNLNVFFDQPIDELKISYNYGPNVTASDPSPQIAGVSDIYWQNNVVTTLLTEIDGSAANLGVSYAGTYGSIIAQADGSYIYTPDTSNPAVINLLVGQTLTETFQYTLSDGSASDTANLIITINGSAVDSDGDSYVDRVDLDDDNDGILDTVECTGTLNVAESGTATQSSIDYGGVPERAIDGTTNGNYFGSPQSTTHTNTEDNPWWQVDLGSEEAITQIVVWNRTDCCTTRLNNFILEILDSSSTVIYTYNHSGSVSGSTTVNLSSFITGQFVRIRLEGTGRILSLAEVQVFACENTDGDTLPNYLDTDSDGDGCYDAVEGSENVDQNDLISSGTHVGRIDIGANGGVDANGVPNLVNTGGAADNGNNTQGQGVGTSATVNTEAVPNLTITNPVAACGAVDITAAAVTVGSTPSGGAFTYWTDATATNTLATPSAITTSGTYYIKLESVTGCYDIKPVTVTITENTAIA